MVRDPDADAVAREHRAHLDDGPVGHPMLDRVGPGLPCREQVGTRVEVGHGGRAQPVLERPAEDRERLGAAGISSSSGSASAGSSRMARSATSSCRSSAPAARRRARRRTRRDRAAPAPPRARERPARRRSSAPGARRVRRCRGRRSSPPRAAACAPRGNADIHPEGKPPSPSRNCVVPSGARTSGGGCPAEASSPRACRGRSRGTRAWRRGRRCSARGGG